MKSIRLNTKLRVSAATAVANGVFDQRLEKAGIKFCEEFERYKVACETYYWAQFTDKQKAVLTDPEFKIFVKGHSTTRVIYHTYRNNEVADIEPLITRLENKRDYALYIPTSLSATMIAYKDNILSWGRYAGNINSETLYFNNQLPYIGVSYEFFKNGHAEFKKARQQLQKVHKAYTVLYDKKKELYNKTLCMLNKLNTSKQAEEQLPELSKFYSFHAPNTTAVVEVGTPFKDVLAEYGYKA